MAAGAKRKAIRKRQRTRVEKFEDYESLLNWQIIGLSVDQMREKINEKYKNTTVVSLSRKMIYDDLAAAEAELKKMAFGSLPDQLRIALKRQEFLIQKAYQRYLKMEEEYDDIIKDLSNIIENYSTMSTAERSKSLLRIKTTVSNSEVINPLPKDKNSPSKLKTMSQSDKTDYSMIEDLLYKYRTHRDNILDRKLRTIATFEKNRNQIIGIGTTSTQSKTQVIFEGQEDMEEEVIVITSESASLKQKRKRKKLSSGSN